MKLIHSLALVDEGARIGEGTRVWAFSHIRDSAQIGDNCILGEGVYVDSEVIIGDRSKVQNRALLYGELELRQGVFVGPAAIFCNDSYPRARSLTGKLKGAEDWERRKTTVGEGASIGAGAVIGPGLNIGDYAMIGMGAIVTRDVPAYALVLGNPARIVCKVSKDGKRAME